MRALLAALLALTVASPALAQRDTAGVGFMLCRDAMQLQIDQSARWTVAHWALGYMTGLNTATLSEARRFRDLTGMAPDVVFERIRRHCDANPNDRVVSAAMALWRALPLGE